MLRVVYQIEVEMWAEGPLVEGVKRWPSGVVGQLNARAMVQESSRWSLRLETRALMRPAQWQLFLLDVISLWEAVLCAFSVTYLISEPSASDIHSSVAPWATSLSQMTWLLSPSQLGSRSFGSLEKGVELPVFRSSTRTSALWMRDEREYLWGVYIARVPSGLGDADNLRLWLWLHVHITISRKKHGGSQILVDTDNDFEVAVMLGAPPAPWELALGRVEELGCEIG